MITPSRIVHAPCAPTFAQDADVTLVPEGDLVQTAARWAKMAPALRNASWPEFISNADSMCVDL